jgi:hypothetical protein|tara:strand:- start:75 stop:656 length:582 start_codon:yes stop_codon:yes gene_type:complete
MAGQGVLNWLREEAEEHNRYEMGVKVGYRVPDKDNLSFPNKHKRLLSVWIISSLLIGYVLHLIATESATMLVWYTDSLMGSVFRVLFWLPIIAVILPLLPRRRGLLAFSEYEPMWEIFESPKTSTLILLLISVIIAILPLIFWDIGVPFLPDPDYGTGGWLSFILFSIPAGCGFFIISLLIVYVLTRPVRKQN